MERNIVILIKTVDTVLIVLYNSKSNGAGWSSMVARRAHNPKVVGSNPAPATKY